MLTELEQTICKCARLQYTGSSSLKRVFDYNMEQQDHEMLSQLAFELTH